MKWPRDLCFPIVVNLFDNGIAFSALDLLSKIKITIIFRDVRAMLEIFFAFWLTDAELVATSQLFVKTCVLGTLLESNCSILIQSLNV